MLTGVSMRRHDDLAPLDLSVTGPCRVLIVDDDPLVRERLRILLDAAQYQVEVATTAMEALSVLELVPCHVVLTDWEMPDMDGLALCRHLRLQSRAGYVYILMLTVRDSAPDLLLGLAAGADDYVVKGAPVEEILARLEIGRRISHGQKAPEPRQSGVRDTLDIDPPTGAHSFQYLLQHLPRELARSQRHGRWLAVLTCRIDGFHRFVDRFGGEAGDERLRGFVGNVLGSMRRSDWLARSPHDAFIVVLPETEMAGAHRASEKLRSLFAAHPLSTPAAPLGFTVSVEVTSLDGAHDAHAAAKIDALLREAATQKNNIRPFGTDHSWENAAADAVYGDCGKALN